MTALPLFEFPAEDPALMRGRRFSADDLQLMLLGLLEEKPSHGYELIKALGQRSNGAYKPSPGMVYPALGCLQDQGCAKVVLEGNKKCFHLTQAGRQQLEAHRDSLTILFNRLEHVARKMAWMRRALAQQPVELGPDGADRETGWLPEYVQARQAIKHALLERTSAPPAEQRRIAAILARATAEIQAGPPA